MRRALAVLCIALWSTVATASDWYVEGPPVQTRADAVSMSQVAKAAGYKSRVVRRYKHGSGWEYVFVAEGFEERLAASQAARVIADQTGRGVSVFSSVDGGAELAETVNAGPGGKLPREEAVAKTVVRPGKARLPADADVDQILAAALKAHGGDHGGLALLDEAESVRFRFRRTLPDGTVTVHTYARSGTQRYLDVRVEQGDAKGSTLRVLDGGAFLQVDGGAPTRGDADRALETVERFSPARVLDLSVSFAQEVKGRAELQKLHLDGQTTVEGATCRVLRFDGDRVSRPIALAVGDDDQLLRQLATGGEGGGVVKQFDQYEQVEPSLMIPKRVRSWIDRDLVDDVEVLELAVGTRLPDDWLAIPGD